MAEDLNGESNGVTATTETISEKPPHPDNSEEEEVRVRDASPFLRGRCMVGMVNLCALFLRSEKRSVRCQQHLEIQAFECAKARRACWTRCEERAGTKGPAVHQLWGPRRITAVGPAIGGAVGMLRATAWIF